MPPKPTVDERIGCLQAALRAIAPIADRAGIPWREGEAYDDWDALASAAYQAFVGEDLTALVEDGRVSRPPLPMAPYDLQKGNYSGYSFVRAVGPDIGANVFNRLKPEEGRFDVAELLLLDSGLSTTGEQRLSALDATQFELAVRFGSNESE